MKYHCVCIAVDNIGAAREFYEDLFGLEVIQDYGKNISFSCGISLQEDFGRLLEISDERIIKEPSNMELYFEEDDFDAFVEKLKTFPGVKYHGDGVKEMPWGQLSIRFYDPDGHIIEVGENLVMVIKRFLGSGMTLEETSERMGVSVPDLETLLNSQK